MRVARLIRGESTSYVVLRSNRFLLDYLNVRNIRFKTSQDEHSGFKIPRAAIVDRTVLRIPTEFIFDNENGFFVMRRIDGIDVLTAVNLASTFSAEEPFMYVHQDFEAIRLGDIIVRGGDNPETHSVSEVDNVRGIFKVNRGYTEFFRVNIDENTRESGGYYFLDPALNAGLRISDRIILDSRNVRERQIVN